MSKGGGCLWLSVWRNWGFPTLGYMPLVLIQTTLSTILPRHARSPALGPDCCGFPYPPLMNIHTARLWRELSANQSEVVASPAHTHARGIPSLPPSCQNSSVPVRLLACTHVLRVLGRLAEFAFPLELKFTLESCHMTLVWNNIYLTLSDAATDYSISESFGWRSGSSVCGILS